MDTPKAKPRRLYSFPPHRSVSTTADFLETEYITANEVFPVSVPLTQVQIGSISYISKEWNDIEVLYELESSDILVRSIIEGEKGEPPGTYRISGVSAADLSLYCVVPSSLESMVSRLILELEDDIVFEPTFQGTLAGSPQTDQPEVPENPEVDSRSLKSRVVKMSASAHEAGHFRDILLFLKCENVADLNPEFGLPTQKGSKGEDESETKSPQLTFLEFLPFWAMYIPWWLYSRNARTILQRIILVYYVLSVIWAMWQLYRHVYVIQVVLEPIISALKLYLCSVMEYIDWFLALFTRLWNAYLSPLNVLRALLVTPIFQVLFQFKTIITPMFTFVTQCLKSSAVLTAFKTLFSLFTRLGMTTWSAVWTCVVYIGKPFSGIWQAILNSRVAVASLDFQRLRLSWVFGMVIGSLKSIGNGLAWFVGYTHKTKKRRKAMAQVSPESTPTASVKPQDTLRKRRMPVYYNSPLSKQN